MQARTPASTTRTWITCGTLFMLTLTPARTNGDAARPPAELAATATAMRQEVERLRSIAFPHEVDVGVYTTTQMQAFLNATPDESQAAPATRSLAERGFQLVGLLPADAHLDTLTQAMFGTIAPPGIYDHVHHELRVLERPDGNYADFSVRLTLVHELTHALDDQLFDLARLADTGHATSDQENVWGALVEGSAVTIQEQYRAAATRSGNTPPAEIQQSAAEAAEQMRAMTTAPPIPAVFFARFPSGVRFLQFGARHLLKTQAPDQPAPSLSTLADVSAAVPSAYGTLPASTEQILHPEKYWDPARRDAPATFDDDAIEQMVATLGLRIAHRDTLGELLCAVVTSPADKRINPMFMPLPGYWTTPAATGWDGDRLYVLVPSTPDASTAGQPQGLWITQWD
ncbi:MAG TPA: hypothetical protein P5572_22425, partial [Phycisphaerae bacterium]|nr:hypothetical protein [Phycisphaerae bacterium]